MNKKIKKLINKAKEKKNRVTVIIISILLIGTVLGVIGGINESSSIAIKNVVIPADAEEEYTSGIITYKCAGVEESFEIHEKGEWKDDAYDGANALCKEEVTLITDWNSRVLQEYEGYYSFDTKKLEDLEKGVLT